MIAAMTRLRLYLIRMSKNTVKTSRMPMKMNGFSYDDGSSNAVMPDACTGSDSKRAPISTARSRRGIARRGIKFFLSTLVAPLFSGSLINLLSSSKSMELREYWIDILLTIVMVISTLVLILRFWQDITIAIAAALMMLSIGGLFLSLQVKMRHLEESVIARERMLRTNLEVISTRMVDKYDLAISHLDELVAEMSKRAYK